MNLDSLDFVGVEGEGQSAKIAVLGNIISIAGQCITTYAAVLAIEEAKNESEQGIDNGELSKELKEMRAQLTCLTEEIRSLKSNLGNEKKDTSQRV